jgi:hypothetical protein
MERWTYRTWAYVALMTDDYPPFRLDMGATESSTLPGGPAGETKDIPADVP